MQKASDPSGIEMRKIICARAVRITTSELWVAYSGWRVSHCHPHGLASNPWLEVTWPFSTYGSFGCFFLPVEKASTPSALDETHFGPLRCGSALGTQRCALRVAAGLSPSRLYHFFQVSSDHLSRRVYDKVSFDFPFCHLRRITLHHAAARRIALNPRMIFCSIALAFPQLRSLGIYHSTTVSSSSKKLLSSAQGTLLDLSSCCAKDFLLLWLLIWHVIASGTLLKFNTSHRACGTFLLLEATLSCKPDWCDFWSCNGRVPKKIQHVLVKINPEMKKSIIFRSSADFGFHSSFLRCMLLQEWLCIPSYP